jgi:hypothetical protein
VNDQPPGIEEGDIDTIPDSTSAAQRVGEFLEEFGDGLVIGQSRPDEVWGYPPLYARDLQALINTQRNIVAVLKLDDEIAKQRDQMEAERDQARDIAVHLEQELAEVRAALEGEDWHGAVDADTIRAILDRDR